MVFGVVGAASSPFRLSLLDYVYIVYICSMFMVVMKNGASLQAKANQMNLLWSYSQRVTT